LGDELRVMKLAAAHNIINVDGVDPVRHQKPSL
jgi:hypothetical protein